jgi:hypothetical protein
MNFHPLRDSWLKAVSLVLAVSLWMVVAGEPVVERGLDVPLEFENVPRGLAVLGDETDSVRVRVRGLASALARIAPGTVVARLDLSGERPGRKLYDLFPDAIEAPPGVEVTSVIPATVTLTLEHTGTTRMEPIVPDSDRMAPNGLRSGRTAPGSPVVEVRGPGTGSRARERRVPHRSPAMRPEILRRLRRSSASVVLLSSRTADTICPSRWSRSRRCSSTLGNLSTHHHLAAVYVWH